MNDDLIPFLIVLIHVNARLFRFVRMRLKPVAPPLLNFHIQSVPRLISSRISSSERRAYSLAKSRCIATTLDRTSIRPAPVSSAEALTGNP
jgi:hypothetical protein